MQTAPIVVPIEADLRSFRIDCLEAVLAHHDAILRMAEQVGPEADRLRAEIALLREDA